MIGVDGMSQLCCGSGTQQCQWELCHKMLGRFGCAVADMKELQLVPAVREELAAAMVGAPCKYSGGNTTPGKIDWRTTPCTLNDALQEATGSEPFTVKSLGARIPTG